jgi:hypothetical protein
LMPPQKPYEGSASSQNNREVWKELSPTRGPAKQTSPSQRKSWTDVLGPCLSVSCHIQRALPGKTDKRDSLHLLAT